MGLGQIKIQGVGHIERGGVKVANTLNFDLSQSHVFL